MDAMPSFGVTMITEVPSNPQLTLGIKFLKKSRKLSVQIFLGFLFFFNPLYVKSRGTYLTTHTQLVNSLIAEAKLTGSLKINTCYRDLQYGNGTRILIKFVRYSITWGQITKLA